MTKATGGYRLFVSVVSVVLFAATSTPAVQINFSTGGDTASFDVGNMTADGYLDAFLTGSVDLVPNVPQVVQINTAGMDITVLEDAIGSSSFVQNLTISSPLASPVSQSISQAVWVTTYGPMIYAADVEVLVGAYVEFDLGALGTLQVTPLGGEVNMEQFFPVEFPNQARFELIPEPACIAGLAIAALLIRRRR